MIQHGVEACPICNTEGVPYSRLGGEKYQVSCPVCVSYVITGSAKATIAHWDRRRLLLLAGRIKRHWIDTSRPMFVETSLLDTVIEPALVSVTDKQNAVLLMIAALSKHPGAPAKLQPLDCVVFDGEPGDELGYHLLSLEERKLINVKSTVMEPVVTAKGWELIERVRNPIGGNRSDIFVAMSFSAALRPAWEDGLRPGIAAAGYTPKRVDSDAHNDKIDDRIIAGIRSSYATVVDVTTQNAGAYFEAGFALGLGRPVIWTVQLDDLKNLHFDTRQFNHLVWAEPKDLAEKLTTHLLAVFGPGPVRR